MRIKKLITGSTIALLLVCATSVAHAQTAAAATAPTAYAPFAIGAGFSSFSTGWNNPVPSPWGSTMSGQMLGGTLWIDYSPNHVPHILRGIGIEAMARDISIATNSQVQLDMREDIAAGGVQYAWPRYRKFRPFAKGLMGLGNDEYPIEGQTVRYEQSRTVTLVGGGLDWLAYRSFWLRTEYQYEFWPDFFKHPGTNIPTGQLNPNGVTVGVVYRFGGAQVW